MAAKAADYLAAGVARVWIIDPRAKSITVFLPDAPPQTFMESQVIEDAYLEGLRLTVAEVFNSA